MIRQVVSTFLGHSLAAENEERRDKMCEREREREAEKVRHVAEREEAPPTSGSVRERVLDFWNADHWGPGTSR